MINIKYKKTIDLIPYVNNTRTHDDKQINQISSSIISMKKLKFNFFQKSA